MSKAFIITTCTPARNFAGHRYIGRVVGRLWDGKRSIPCIQVRRTDSEGRLLKRCRCSKKALRAARAACLPA